MPSAWSFESDIQSIVDDIGFEWEQLAHANIFITGGTGFIGKWLLETLLAANHDLKLDLCITVLSRDPENFFSEAPKLDRYITRDFIYWREKRVGVICIPLLFMHLGISLR